MRQQSRTPQEKRIKNTKKQKMKKNKKVFDKVGNIEYNKFCV